MNANFIRLDELEKLDALFRESHSRPVVLFKHSETCPISRNIFEEMAAVDHEIWLIIVQNSRFVSDAIADKTDVKHESPQTIIIRNGKAVYHSSHYDITANDIAQVLSGEAANI